MPNWCSNVLVATGDVVSYADRVKNLAASKKEDKIGFFSSFVLPVIPEDFERYDDDVMPDWYIANCQSWGTKWDVPIQQIDLVDDEDDVFGVRFSTAWSPPFEFVLQLSEQYAELLFELQYDEPGMGFGGVALFKDGQFWNEEIDMSNVDWGDGSSDDEWEKAQGQIDGMFDAAREAVENRYYDESRAREWSE